MKNHACALFLALMILAGGLCSAVAQTAGGEVVVRGQVLRPGTVTFDIPLKLSEAIERAGGLLPHALTGRVRITRTVGGRKLLFIIDLDGVRKGGVQDVGLESGDLIEVPRKNSRPKMLQKGRLT